MNPKALLKHQTIFLDPHGHFEMKSFSDRQHDFHIHKITKTKIESIERDVTIKIPLNSNRNVTITSNNVKYPTIPRKLYKEIRNALGDNDTERNRFLESLIDALKDYPKDFSKTENAKQCIMKIGLAFGFDWRNLNVKYDGASAKIIDMDKEEYKIALQDNKVIVEGK